MKQTSAVRRTTSSRMPRFSCDAVISRKQSSSAPALSYSIACSTGSPASRRSTKLTPLTTRPSFTSRQGMMRTFSISAFFAIAATLNKARPQAASAGTPVVLHKASASKSRSSASPSLVSFHFCAWLLKEAAREKCTGGRSLRMAPSMLSPRAASTPTSNRRWKCDIACRSTATGETSAVQSRSSARSRRARSPEPAASQASSTRTSASSPITARTSSSTICFLPRA